MKRDGQQITDINSLKMLSLTAPGKALAMLVLLFSLAGVPPSLGFFAKFQNMTDSSGILQNDQTFVNGLPFLPNDKIVI